MAAVGELALDEDDLVCVCYSFPTNNLARGIRQCFEIVIN